MYYEYWGLQKPPFDNVPDPSMYADCHSSVEDAIAETLFAIEEGNECIAVIISDVGMGKTLSLRLIMDSLDQEKYRIALVTNPGISFIELLREIIGQLTGTQCMEKRKVDLLETFNKILFEVADEGKKVLIFIDEANAIAPANLESLRLLTNMQDDRRNLFTLILAGQIELGKRLEHPKRANLFQRIGTYSRIQKMSSEDTIRTYIETRLRLSGGTRKIFTDDSIGFLWEYSENGVPRLLNKIAKLCLKAGETNGFDSIDGETVRQVGERFRKLSSFAVHRRKPGKRSDSLHVPVREVKQANVMPEEERDRGIISAVNETQSSQPPGNEEESNQAVKDDVEEFEIGAFNIRIRIPLQNVPHIKYVSHDHRLKTAGVLAADVLKQHPQLTSAPSADPIAIWSDLRNLILQRLEHRGNGNSCHNPIARSSVM